MKFMLGVDIGTQGSKGVLINEDLKIVADCYLEHEPSVPNPGWAEQDADSVWWSDFLEIVRRLIRETSVAPDDISCVGCSGVSPCVLPVDSDGKPLRPAILYSDTRVSEGLQQEVMNILAANPQITMRNPLSSQSVAPKVLWLRHNEPRTWHNMYKLFTTTNYIIYKLTGNFVLDYSQAALYEPLYNYDKMDWSEQVCQAFGMTRKQLPKLGKPTEIAGTVIKRAAEQSGLAAGTPVIISTSDGLSEMISVGGYQDDRLALIYGSTGAMGATFHKAPVMRDLSVVPHPLFSNRHMILASTATAGILTSWFLKNFGSLEAQRAKQKGINAYKSLSREAEKISPGSDGLVVLPYFSGERTPLNDLRARGVLFGLTLYHTKAHIYRALLEGIAYSFKHNLEAMKNYTGNITNVIASGGGTKSELWVQIVSDVIGQDQLIPIIPTGAEIGTAYLCGIAVGLVKNLDRLGRHALENARKVSTRADFYQVYKSYYEIYRNLYFNTRSDMHHLSELGKQIRKGRMSA